MACSHPNPVVVLGINSLTGKRIIKFLPHRYDMNIQQLKMRWGDRLMLLPCGKCPSCQSDKAKNWAVRCYLESLSYGDDNCFITLTYNDENCPKFLNKRDVQLFLKRLRKSLPDRKISYFLCGEYGSITKRPHYHALIFGFLPSDLEEIGTTQKGNKLFTSDMMSNLWGKGFVSIGLVSPESICYCARYTTKKLDCIPKDKSLKEFLLMSRRPGLGFRYVITHLEELSESDDKLYLGEFGIKNFSRYILDILKETNPLEYESIIQKRLDKCKQLIRDRMLRENKSIDEIYTEDLNNDLEKDKFNKRGF